MPGDAVRVTTDLQVLSTSTLRAVESATGDAVDGALRAAFTRALRRWPVDTGRSKRELVLRRGGVASWTVRGTAPYTGDVRLPDGRLAADLLYDELQAGVEEVARG